MRRIARSQGTAGARPRHRIRTSGDGLRRGWLAVPVVAGALALAAPATASAATAAATPTVTATIPAGNDPEGVATNPLTDTIYVANDSDNTVSVINGKTDTVTATIPVGKDPAGVATNPLTNTAYVTNAGGSTVSVISG